VTSDPAALGDRELDLMQVLWRRGEATVAEVQQSLAAGGTRLAYTSVQTMLNRLEAKGMVGRSVADRAHVYHALAPEPKVVGSLLERLADRFFKGSVERLATHLLESELSVEELDRLQALIAAERARRGR
jgi:predicted transcriptional regulator